MTKIDDYFAKYQVDGEITWPSNSDERDRLASDLLGAEIVGSLDHWVDRAEDYIRNRVSSREFPRKNRAWQRDVAIRAALADMTPEQQNAVVGLIAETASGAVFSTLVAFDQCVGVDIRIAAHDRTTSEKVASILPGGADLHDRLYDWIDAFLDRSERYDRIEPAG